MGRILNRHLGKVAEILPGQYCVDKPCIFIACPSCGCLDDVSVTQPPMRSGLLPGRWECRAANCGYRDFVSLGDWDAC